MEKLELAIFEKQENNCSSYEFMNPKGNKSNVNLFTTNDVLTSLYTTSNTPFTDLDALKDNDQVFRRNIILTNIFYDKLQTILNTIIGQVVFNINSRAEKLSLPIIYQDCIFNTISYILDSPIGDVSYYINNNVYGTVNEALVYDTTSFIILSLHSCIIPKYTSFLDFTSKEHSDFYNFMEACILSCARDLNNQFCKLFTDIRALITDDFCDLLGCSKEK